jgi:hypothetical protein
MNFLGVIVSIKLGISCGDISLYTIKDLQFNNCYVNSIEDTESEDTGYKTD